MGENIETMQAEFLNIWNSMKLNRFGEAIFFDLDKYLAESFGKAHAHAIGLIPKHLFLLDQAISCLLLFTRFVGERKMNMQSVAFISQVHRSVNCLIAIRLLLINGLEEVGRPISRNYLESLDMSLACLVDDEFATQLAGDEGADFDAFWKRCIGYGKVYQYLRKACELAGFSEKEADEYIQYRKELKSILSSSVHSDHPGAFRSMAPPPLGYPDMVSTEPHGIVNVHTADHAAAVIGETFKYLSLVSKILFFGSHQHNFDLAPDGVNVHTFFAHFFSFQEIYYRHDLPCGDEIIAPDYSE